VANEAADVKCALTQTAGDGAVLVPDDPLSVNERTRIAELALKHRLPAVAGHTQIAKAGVMMAYGPNRIDLYRRAAGFVDKILKGAKPADLPVEQPTKFELVINLKTAKALGLTFPPTLLLRADQVMSSVLLRRPAGARRGVRLDSRQPSSTEIL
jgi:putative ABC transport system substrate-binding protein